MAVRHVIAIARVQDFLISRAGWLWFPLLIAVAINFFATYDGEDVDPGVGVNYELPIKIPTRKTNTPPTIT